MSEIIGAVTLGVMAILGLIAVGYILYGLVVTLWSVAEVEFHLPEIHNTGGLAPHH